MRSVRVSPVARLEGAGEPPGEEERRPGGDHHIGAGGREGGGDGLADTAPATGDDRNAVGEVESHLRTGDSPFRRRPESRRR